MSQTPLWNRYSLLDDAVIRFDFLAEGNSPAGWSGPEENFRWMIGDSSSLRCRPLRFGGNIDLFVHMTPFGNAQSLTIRVNGIEIDHFRLERAGWYASAVPREVLSETKENVVSFDHPEARRPIDASPPSMDTRLLAIAVRGAALVPRPDNAATVSQIAAQPKPADATSAKALATRFESLGQNCEFGLFQRLCGAEPLGLLRFSSIRQPELIEGLETGFADIADDGALTFFFAMDNECHGRHTKYGLNYHTFRYRQDIDLGDFLRTEKIRLRFLADRLMEQVSQADKIFVLQRSGLTFREVRPVLKLLQIYNPRNRLLWVSEADHHDRIGTVDLIGETCARGHIDRLAPEQNAPDLSFEVWMNICVATAKIFSDVQQPE